MRLSIVRILPHAAHHNKKDTVLGTFTHQTLFRGNEWASFPSIALQKERKSKWPFLSNLQDNLSSPNPRGNFVWIRSKKEYTASLSKSWKSLWKRKFQLLTAPYDGGSNTSETKSYLSTEQGWWLSITSPSKIIATFCKNWLNWGTSCGPFHFNN